MYWQWSIEDGGARILDGPSPVLLSEVLAVKVLFAVQHKLLAAFALECVLMKFFRGAEWLLGANMAEYTHIYIDLQGDWQILSTPGRSYEQEASCRALYPLTPTRR